MSKGLFDLADFDSMSESSILDMNIDAEDTNMNEDTSISVPGGLSETPSAKPYDASSVKIPNGTTITVDEYNDALTMLQKSFKEGYEAMGMLIGAKVVTESVDDLQEDYTWEAIAESYINGPMFEAVDRSDKKYIKSIIKKNKKRILNSLNNDSELATADYSTLIAYSNALGEALIGAIGLGVSIPRKAAGASTNGLLISSIGSIIGAVGDAIYTFIKLLGIHGWQILGAVSPGKINDKVYDKYLDDAIEKINEEFKDELGEYKIYRTETVRLGFKNPSNRFSRKLKRFFFGEEGYILIIDKEKPTELNKAIKAFNKAKDDIEKGKVKGAKPLKEGADCTDPECDPEKGECKDPNCKHCKDKKEDDE